MEWQKGRVRAGSDQEPQINHRVDKGDASTAAGELLFFVPLYFTTGASDKQQKNPGV
jgi:hypothetical protein